MDNYNEYGVWAKIMSGAGIINRNKRKKVYAEIEFEGAMWMYLVILVIISAKLAFLGLLYLMRRFAVMDK